MLKTEKRSAMVRTAKRSHVRVNEGLIDALSFVISSLLLPDLLLKAETLLKGIIQLSVGVAELLAAHEALETLAETGT